MPRSISQQSVAELGGPGSVLVRQRRDHVELDGLLRRLTSTAGDAQDQVLSQVRRLVFSHAFAEEAVLWPALRRAVPGGEELTAGIEREHQEINELVRRLETSRPTDSGREDLLEHLVRLLDEDVRDEEDVVLPRLQDAVAAQTLRRLGRSWEAVRRTAPTRPHPIVSRRPPGNVLAALPLTVLDRTRDVLDRVGRQAPAPARPVAHGAGVAVRLVSELVEHLPPLRAGEDTGTRAGSR